MEGAGINTATNSDTNMAPKSADLSPINQSADATSSFGRTGENFDQSGDAATSLRHSVGQFNQSGCGTSSLRHSVIGEEGAALLEDDHSSEGLSRINANQQNLPQRQRTSEKDKNGENEKLLP